MSLHDRRCDRISSGIVDEALKIQRAFDQSAAITFLKTRGIKDELTVHVLSGRYDRRITFRREKSRCNTPFEK
jgi:hypothetical protein